MEIVTRRWEQCFALLLMVVGVLALLLSQCGTQAAPSSHNVHYGNNNNNIVESISEKGRAYQKRNESNLDEKQNCKHRDCVGHCLSSLDSLGDGICNGGSSFAKEKEIFACPYYNWDNGDCKPEDFQGCLGGCGWKSLNQDCYCDESCLYYGDCCSDFSSTCPRHYVSALSLQSRNETGCFRGSIPVMDPSGAQYSDTCVAKDSEYQFIYYDTPVSSECQVIPEKFSSFCVTKDANISAASNLEDASQTVEIIFRNTDFYSITRDHSAVCADVVANVICRANFPSCSSKGLPFSTCSPDCKALFSKCGDKIARDMFGCDYSCTFPENPKNNDDNVTFVRVAVISTLVGGFVVVSLVAVLVATKRRTSKDSNEDAKDRTAKKLRGMEIDLEELPNKAQNLSDYSISTNQISPLLLQIQEFLTVHGPPILYHLDIHGWGLIHYAAAAGDLSSIELLLSVMNNNNTAPNSSAIEFRDKKNMTALLWACQRANINSIKLLLDKGANALVVNSDNESTLHLICRYGSPSKDYNGIVSMLVSMHSSLLEGMDSEGYTPLLRAVCNGNLALAQHLIFLGASLECSDRFGINPLIASVKYSHGELFSLLLPKIPLDAADNNGWTTLHWACATCDHYAVEQLLKPGHSFAIRNIRNELGQTGLHLAAREGYLELVQLLLNLKCKTNLEDISGLLPIDYAQNNKHYRVVQLLSTRGTSKGLSPSDTDGVSGSSSKVTVSPSSVSPSTDSPDTSLETSDEVQVEKQQQNENSSMRLKINQTTSIVQKRVPSREPYFFLNEFQQGLYTSFYELIVKEDFDELSEFLHYHTRPVILEIINVKDDNDVTLISYGCNYWSYPRDFIKLFLDFGADPLNYNSYGESVLHLLCSKTIDSVDKFENILDSIRLLVKHFPEILEMKDVDGNTPFHCACAIGYPTIVCALIQLGANVNALDSMGSTPLIVAIRSHNNLIIPYLLPYSKLMHSDAKGWNVLHWATATNNIEAVQMLQGSLLSYEGLFSEESKRGETALQLAVREHHKEMERLLRSLINSKKSGIRSCVTEVPQIVY